MLDFYKLTPQEFETLCFQYICNLYQKPNYSVKHTRYVHDGGHDIEVTFYDELSHFKIWAECKQHKRNISYMQNHCMLKPVYRDRINSFFTYSDTDCRLRLLKKLKRADCEED